MTRKHSLGNDQIEAWLDDHPAFTQDYFLRKATQSMVNAWLADRVIRIAADEGKLSNPIDKPIINRIKTKTGDADSRPSSASSDAPNSTDRKTPMRKISHEEINPRHLPLKPMVSTDDMGTPSFYTPDPMSPNFPRKSISRESDFSKTRRISHWQNPMMQNFAHDDKDSDGKSIPVMDERDMIMELVRDISMDLDVTSVSHRILQNVSILLEADRCSLFLVREREGEKFLVSRLFDVNKESSLEDTVVMKDEIRINLGQGIAGMVALTGKTLNIPDAYKDSRFNQKVDMKTGFKTRNILCMPIKDGEMKIVGVAQVINKNNGVFTSKDEKIFASYLGFCGIAIHNAQLFEKIQLENRRNEVLLDLARVLFEEQISLPVVMETILTHTTSLLGCERSSILLTDPSQPKNVFAKTFEHVSEEVNLANNLNKTLNGNTAQSTKRKVPFNIAITSYVRQTGQLLNITAVSKDKRFQFEEDHELGFQTRSLMCVPIRDSLHQVIGVIQLINKNPKIGPFFTKSDEQILEAFAIFCGLGISNTRIYEETSRLAAKQQVILEVLSYHAVASPKETAEIASEIQSAQTYDIMRYSFDDTKLSEDDTLRASVRMFIDLNLLEKFHINKETLCRWVASVRRNYRDVRYHNWRHAFNVCQSAFCMIKTGGLGNVLGGTEQLALLVACLSHDLDHRGTNNAFQAKIEHPLARLYSTSTMEHHHYNQCLMLLQSEGCEILSQLSSSEYADVIKLIQHAILSTDLAIYFKKRQAFFDIVESGKQDWKGNEAHKKLLRGMAMTATDVSAITKPWLIQFKVAQQVAEEFFEQGDIEKNQLHQEPIDMMNRKLRHKLPSMQVGFIDGICLPLYQCLSKVSPGLAPLLDGCLSNKRHWGELAKKNFSVGTSL